MSTKVRRAEIEIEREILSAMLLNPITISKLRRKCNLNLESVRRTVDKLVADRLVECDQMNGKSVFKPTDTGKEYLSRIEVLLKIRNGGARRIDS